MIELEEAVIPVKNKHTAGPDSILWQKYIISARPTARRNKRLNFSLPLKDGEAYADHQSERRP